MTTRILALIVILFSSLPSLAGNPAFYALNSSGTPPQFIQEVQTPWNTTTTPKTTSSFNVMAGDVLVAYAIRANDTGAGMSISGGSLTWTLQNKINTGTNLWAEVDMWTAIVTTSQSMTVSFSAAGGGDFGGDVMTFRGSDGVGYSASANVSSAAPSLSMTTSADNSAVVVANGDWNAVDGSSRTWRLSATEKAYTFASGEYTIYGAYHAKIGAKGTYTVGLSAPAGQNYSIVAVEVKGSGGGAYFCNGQSNPAAGTVCTDGSIYAGPRQYGKHLFTTTSDQGKYAWNNGNSTGYTTTNATNADDGKANSTTVIATDSDSGTGGVQPHLAAQACTALTANGHSDWYLPSANELTTMYNNRTAIGGFTTAGGEAAGAYYWSSTEINSTDTNLYQFDLATPHAWNKNWPESVRCVRTD